MPHYRLHFIERGNEAQKSYVRTMSPRKEMVGLIFERICTAFQSPSSSTQGHTFFRISLLVAHSSAAAVLLSPCI